MKKSHSRPSVWTLAKIHFFRAMGKTGTDIARRVGISKSAVYRYLKK